jgi:rubrerythrin
MSKADIQQLEQMIEIIARTIPKETAAAKLYAKTAKDAQREMARLLFAKLARDASEHETKLRATLDILRKELVKARSGGAEPVVDEGGACMPPHEFNVTIRRALRVASEMEELGKDGLSAADDPSCQAMYETILRYSAHVRALAQEEIDKHIVKEKWD